MNMFKWIGELKQSKEKKAMPILSFPSVQLMGISVKELISDSAKQAEGMKRIADRVDSLASVSMMDLSVEAEAFGATVRFSDDEVPTVIGHIIDTEEDAANLAVPDVSAGRCGIYTEAIERACKLITDRPVFAGVIGPYSLAGRLLDVSEIMIKCYEDPDTVLTVLEKATEFIIKYIEAYKAVGANGVVIAEPLAGLLSPSLMEEFSAPFVKKIVDKVQDESFIVIYHNCGNEAVTLINHILTAGAAAYHFGNAIDMKTMLTKVPSDTVVMGNIAPAEEFRGGTVESIRKATLGLLDACASHSNFVISSGCDIPPTAKWENIDSFFKAVSDFYSGAKS